MPKLPLGQLHHAYLNPGTSTENVMANCEMFVNPEQLNRGLLAKHAILLSNSAACGLPAFSKPVTFHDDMLRLLLRIAEQVRILWDSTLLSLLPGCRQSIPFSFLGWGRVVSFLRVGIAEVIR